MFAVLEKDKDHHSSMYDDACMPNMQRITWNGLALHGGPLPGLRGLARLRADALRLCGEAVRQDADRDARDHLAERRELRSSFPTRRCSCRSRDAVAAAPARAETLAREAAEAAKTARRGEESRRDCGARAAIAHGVDCASWNGSESPCRRRARVRRAEALAGAKTDQARARAEER